MARSCWYFYIVKWHCEIGGLVHKMGFDKTEVPMTVAGFITVFLLGVCNRKFIDVSKSRNQDNYHVVSTPISTIDI